MAEVIRSDAARNREALVEAATRLFIAAGGDAEPSLRLIAREAGVGVGTLLGGSTMASSLTITGMFLWTPGAIPARLT